ncbi:MAG: hypothetical protein ACTHZW_10830 [Microbacteriaceae bacterium]|uniref:Uncharacterized protein n=1 Tax=Brevibacterium aurantiacum TaxID=273384 RepID=A0A2A3YY67_BREAU|nr:hypothetical protein [Brevibacterium sp.]PCC44266.1 hypothetical protein CIK65_01300 [Brevibacterium aurantiacum]HCG55817.1 hypothetical protein [Brevibacterium sp.]
MVAVTAQGKTVPLVHLGAKASPEDRRSRRLIVIRDSLGRHSVQLSRLDPLAVGQRSLLLSKHTQKLSPAQIEAMESCVEPWQHVTVPFRGSKVEVFAVVGDLLPRGNDGHIAGRLRSSPEHIGPDVLVRQRLAVEVGRLVADLRGRAKAERVRVEGDGWDDDEGGFETSLGLERYRRDEADERQFGG